MLTEEEFMKGMALLMSAYPDYECPPKTVDIYRARLRTRLTPEQWEKAVLDHIDRHKWFPKISELLEVSESGTLTAREVWAWLLKEAESGEKPLLDAVTERALTAIGGWSEFCVTSYETLDFKFKHFQTVYSEALKEKPGQKALPEPE